MSTEKLSELSKPVMYSITCNGVVEEIGGDSQGFVREEVQAELDSWENGSVGIPDGYSVSALYSQEYVSALLAELEAKDKRIAEAEVRGVEKLAAAFKSWASDETFPDCEAQRHWATASQEALSFAGDLRNGSCDDR